MKRKRMFLVGAILSIILVIFTFAPVYSYNNDNEARSREGGPHRAINYYAIQSFLNSCINDPIFKKYDFSSGSSLTGIAVKEPGAWNITEGEEEKKWYEWSVEGGYTADEPEAYMSLRHFYDPLAINHGATYLTDHVDELMGHITMGYNPKTDAHWWGALHSPYSLDKGREFMASAFSSSNSQEKERLFAAAWRSLGETMHLLADMTVPAHVRNDSHPGILAWATDKWRADPYEKYVTQDVVENCLGPVDPVLIEEINTISQNEDGVLQVLSLFDFIARYTNRNFFSLDTIAGLDRVSGQTFTNANGMPEYPSPRLENLKVDEEGYYYRNDYLGKSYLVRVYTSAYKDRTLKHPIAGELNLATQIEMDERCLLSQAQRLIPAAVYAGEKLIEWFMPRIEVHIDSFVAEKDENNKNIGILKGQVIHKPTAMYDQPLLFTLPQDQKVQMIINNRLFEPPLGSVSIQKGIIEGKIPSIPEGPVQQISLLVDIGGIVVSSSDLQVYGLQLHPERLEGWSKERYGFYVQSDNPPPEVRYIWDFGDGRIEETDGTSLTHTYESEGEYRLQVQMKDSSTGKILAVAQGKAYISPQEEISEGMEPITPKPTSTTDVTLIEETPPQTLYTPAPTPDEEAHRQQVLAEYRSLYPRYVSWFYEHDGVPGRVEIIANAEEVGPDLYRVAYKFWQIIKDGPRKGEEYVGASFDLNFSLGELEASLENMKRKLGIE